MKQQQEIKLKCPIDTHDHYVEFACINQFCQSNRIYCFECFKNGNHNSHTGDQKKIAELFDLFEKYSLKIEELIPKLHQTLDQIIQSFSQLEQGLKNKFLLTKSELCKFDPKQLSTVVKQISQDNNISVNILDDINDKSLVLCDSINKCCNLFGLEEIKIFNQDYQKMLRHNVNNSIRLIIYQNTSKVNEAMENLKKLLPINPNESQCLHLTAEFLKMLENYNEANIKIDQALKKDPKNLQLLQTKVEILKGLGNFEEAIQWTNKILILDPNNLQSIITTAEYLKSVRQYDQAIRYADRALEIDPKKLCSLIIKFESLYMIGNYGDAIVWAQKALDIDSMNLQALIVKAGSLRVNGNIIEAIAQVDSALKKYPQNTNLQEIKSKCQSPNINNQQTQIKKTAMFYQSESNNLFKRVDFNKK